MPQAETSSSFWEPLRQPLYRALWLAAIGSNIGTWMQDVGASWLMTSLAPSPLMVALVQTATMLPMFLLALPAGAVADIVDRRRLLLVTQGWMLVSATILGVVSVTEAISPWLLLALTFSIGLGGALNAPAWQAIIPELVPRRDLSAAITLNGIAVNIARTVGPAIAGLVVSAAGAGATFLLNAASFLGVLVVIYRWRRKPRESALPTERFVGAMRAGLRYARQSPELRAVLVRAASFILFGSSVWALLPVFARAELQSGPAGYGGLLACFGAGAVGGALMMPTFRQKATLDRLGIGSALVFAGTALILAFVREFWIVCAALFAGGGAWLTLLSSFNIAAQAAVSGWVRARALSIYLLVFSGSMAGGSALWGTVAHHAGLPAAFAGAGACILVGLALAPRFPLRGLEGTNLAPSKHWPTPKVAEEPAFDSGPVLVTVEYRVVEGREEEFAEVMSAMGRTRRRDGAVSWGLFADAAEPRRYLEVFLVESWIEHLRQHERATVADRELQARVRRYLVDGSEPKVSHLLAESRM